MKIGFPTNDGKTISQHFGRSRSFLIYDTETGSKEIVPNPHLNESNDTVGHAKLLKMLINKKVKKLIVFNMGMKMGDNLKQVGIGVEFTNDFIIDHHLS